ncbi:MAG: hypothetical protein GEV07_13440 [Streptosporangiales bacterium]|nr:hypothetical protein [Streptosporangiales bacterium]
MSADDLWPFTDVRTADRRGDLLVLEGTAPDGAPVTITRLAPSAATDPEMHRRFHDAVEEASRCIGPTDPRIAWWDTATLSPWAATYDDPHHRGAEMIGALLDPQSALPQPVVQPAAETAPEPVLATLGRTEGPSGLQRRLPLLVGTVAGVAVLVLALGITGFVTRDQPTAGPTAGQSSSPAPSYTSPSMPTATDTDGPTGSSRPTATSRPTLRKVEPKSVYGPTWKRTDSTLTVDLAGLDYAFRVANDYDCFLAGTTSEATHVRCLKLLASEKKMRNLTLTNRDCMGNRCERSQVRLFEALLEGNEHVEWKRKDKTTRYFVTRYVNPMNGERYFKFFLSHVYEDGNEAKHVGVVGEAPVGKFAKEIQKTVNDVRTQSG